MIRSRLFWKIGVGLALIILLSALGVILFVTPGVEREAMAQIEASLLARAQILRNIARPVLEAPGDADAEAALHARLSDLGAETKTRLTVIDAQGRVVADSVGKPATMADPHANRPEVVEARATGHVGTSTRHSRTTGLDLRYLALTVHDEGGTLLGYVRTSLPTTWIDQRRRSIWAGTAIGAGIAALLGLIAGFLLTHRLTHRLSAMADGAKAIAEGRSVAVLPTDAKDETGALARALKGMHEQLEQRHETLVRERNELAGILASMHEGVVAVDREQRVVQMNDVARQMLQIEADPVLGRHIVDVAREVEVCDILEAVVRDDQAQSREVHLVDPPLGRVLELHASPLREPGGDPGGAVLVLHDVTALRRLEAVRREFVANVSHELKTPLTAIQGLLETVLDDEDMDAATRTGFLERALGQSGRLTALVKDLLSLSRIESETGLLERARLDLRRPLRDAADRFEPAVRMRDLIFEVDLAEEPLLIQGDEEGIRQIADNLLDNARKYTSGGGRVRLGLRQVGEEAVLEVTDTGIGIGVEHQSRIFERFYRVDKARSRSLGGTGLGLAIVKHLAEAHGGRVEVESEPGEGSTFRVWLPLARNGEEPARGPANP